MSDNEQGMTFVEYEMKAASTAIYSGRGDNFNYPIRAIGGEAGEILDKFAKLARDHDDVLYPEFVQSVSQEIGDLLWAIAALCYELGVDMEYCAKLNIEKLASRMQRGVIGGSGDDR